MLCLPWLGMAFAGDVRADRYFLFKSTDRGHTWSAADAGLPGTARINALARAVDTLIAGTDAGPFVSDDSGRSWSPGQVESGAPVRVLALVQFQSKVFAGSSDRGLLQSEDRGRHWMPVDRFPPITVRCFATHPQGLAVGTDTQGVFFSSDAGQSWERRDAGLPSGAQVFALSVANGRLFAGLYSKGLFVWDDQERCWTPSEPVRPLALAAVGDTLVAGHNPGGLWWSADGGVTWKEGGNARPHGFGPDFGGITTDLPDHAPVWEMAGGGGLVIAGVASGIYRSDDQGRTWERAVTGLPKDRPGVSFLVTEDLILAGVTRSETSEGE